MAASLPVCYLNGQYLPLAQARISPLDRGFLFADGVYEVMPVYGGRPFRFTAHTGRLTRSLREIRMHDPHAEDEWRAILGGLIERNGGGDQSVYWQVTRGAEDGRNAAPLPHVPRTVFAFCSPLPPIPPAVLSEGIACATAADTRWSRCDIKAVGLLPNVLLRQQGLDAGAAEILLLRDGELTEGSSCAVHVVSTGEDGTAEVVTPPPSGRLLPGTTLSVVEELAARAGLPYRRRPVSEAELRAATEIWISSALREVQPVTRLDEQAVGSGRPGPLFQRVRAEFDRYKQELAGTPW